MPSKDYHCQTGDVCNVHSVQKNSETVSPFRLRRVVRLYCGPQHLFPLRYVPIHHTQLPRQNMQLS